jgi:AraC-type DNA-binding domain-containing proteins
MLLSTDWSIQQVADAMGFPDQASLGQFFKRNEGVSPLAFRKSFRKMVVRFFLPQLPLTAEGDMPYFCLKMRLKWVGFSKPRL